MSQAIQRLQAAQARAMKDKPAAFGFPYLAESLRRAGVRRNRWSLPACQSLYLTDDGPVVMLGEPLAVGAVDVPRFDRDALVRALRADQAGHTTFPQFLEAAWRAGCVGYEADLEARTVTYYGCDDEHYVESYPAVEVPPITP